MAASGLRPTFERLSVNERLCDPVADRALAAVDLYRAVAELDGRDVAVDGGPPNLTLCGGDHGCRLSEDGAHHVALKDQTLARVVHLHRAVRAGLAVRGRPQGLFDHNASPAVLSRVTVDDPDVSAVRVVAHIGNYPLTD